MEDVGEGVGLCGHDLCVSYTVQTQIHWFSIVNSCVTVLLLTGFLATILMRVLKHDFVKYTHDDEAGASWLSFVGCV